MDLKILARIEALMTDREGMVAENKQREHLGHSMAYDEDAFNSLANELRELGK